MKDRVQLYKYVACDAVMALLAWAILNGVRTMQIYGYVEFRFGFMLPMYNAKVLYPIIPFFWCFLYWLSGYYNTIWFKSRLSEFVSTLLCSIIGSLILFFIILIDDPVDDYMVYYESFLTLLALQFGLTYFCRVLITSQTVKKIQKREIGFPTIVLGVGSKAKRLYSELQSTVKSIGYDVEGFVNIEDTKEIRVPKTMIINSDGSLSDLVVSRGIKNVIIATQNLTEHKIYSIMGMLGNTDVSIKLIPTKYQLVTGSVKMDTIYGVPMIDLNAVKLNDFQKNVKRLFDILFSALMLVLLSPTYLALFLLIGRKPIYSQERIGLHGKPFTMYKFRSMTLDAEADDTPRLSSDNDERVTKLGHILRKYRLDELPQFYNVLRGDMSLVGPRPERQYFIKQIAQKAPYYYMLQNVKPGITSWGMVKYGYATSVEQMIERSHYDILYLENASLMLDTKIAIYTIKPIVSGKGI